jgi:hypothetical protein
MICNFVLESIYMLYYVYWFAYAEPTLHSWYKTNSVMCMMFLMCWIQFQGFIYLCSLYWSKIFFFFWVFISFVIRVILVS